VDSGDVRFVGDCNEEIEPGEFIDIIEFGDAIDGGDPSGIIDDGDVTVDVGIFPMPGDSCDGCGMCPIPKNAPGFDDIELA